MEAAFLVPPALVPLKRRKRDAAPAETDDERVLVLTAGDKGTAARLPLCVYVALLSRGRCVCGGSGQACCGYGIFLRAPWSGSSAHRWPTRPCSPTSMPCA
jgi:hypothetical protein